MVSPIGVPPGSRVTKYGTPDFSSRAASRCTCVDLPHPSEPSNVMNGSRGMMSLVRRHCACKDVFQSSKSQQPSSKEPATFNKPSTTDAMLELEVSLDGCELGIYEIL